MKQEDWQLCVKKQFRYSQDIFILEGLASLAGVKHSCRSVCGFGQEHLNVGDNLANVLALESIALRASPCCAFVEVSRHMFYPSTFLLRSDGCPPKLM